MIKSKKDVEIFLHKNFILDNEQCDMIWVHDEHGFYIENGYGHVFISKEWMASVVWNSRKRINKRRNINNV